MWIGKLKIKHDCVIGNRCRKFGVTTMGTPFNVYLENGMTHSPQVHTIHGDQKGISDFISDLRKDRRIRNFENHGNVVFFIEARKEKIPSTYYHNKLFFVKPVYVDTEGFEYWEICSWKKQIIMQFVSSIQKEVGNLEIKNIHESKLDDIYFSHLMPGLTEKQKKAFRLAMENGWYAWPRRTDLGKLAKAAGVSIPTYREHLKRAEGKVMPEFARLLR